MFITVTGGSGSGKSAFAEKCALLLAQMDAVLLPEGKRDGDTAEKLKRGNPVYLAAMNPAGREGRMRVKRHRAMRKGKGFYTIERQRQLTGISPEEILGRTVLVEDLSNLIANELFGGEDPAGEARPGFPETDADAFLSAQAERTCREIREGIGFLASQASHLVLVMNEIFSDGIRYDPQTDQFLRAAGRLSRDFASRADLSYEVVSGIPLVLKKTGAEAERLAERLQRKH